MKNQKGVLYSEHGTVKYMDEQFYGPGTELVLVPLSSNEYQLFVAMIETGEARTGRTLTLAETKRIADLVQK